MKLSRDGAFARMLGFLRQLREAKIAHELCQHRDDAIMIRADIPGERWEIEFVDYGDEVQVEIERFRSNGRIEDESYLSLLLARFAADAPEPTPEESQQYHDAFFRS